MGKLYEVVQKLNPPVPRKKIAKLGKKITDRIVLSISADDPEYWALDELVTDEMADIALTMKIRTPYTLDELVKMTHSRDRDHLEEMLEEMSNFGLLEYTWENPLKIKKYALCCFVPGSAEMFNMKEDLLAAHPREAEFFEDMANMPVQPIAHLIPPGGAGIGMHVVPVEKAIEKESHSLSIEHISHWLDKYDGQITASPCSCRLSRLYRDEGCGDDFHDWCLLCGDLADYAMETGKSDHYVTKEQALEIMQKAEDNGYVHEITNLDGENKIFAICNCNPAVCLALKNAELFNTPNMVRSAYVARVNPEDCVACGQCVEHCPAGAVKLGQKLCTKTGAVQYPKNELPDNYLTWGQDRWTKNYRDINRVECYDTGTAPCKTACPAHIAIQGYLKLAAQGKYDEALALIKKDNPFPAVCGRICNKRCEEECTRGSVDQAIAIDEVKNFLAQRDLDAATRYIPEKVIPSLRGEFPEKIAIIGAGPAGLSCAYYLALKGYRPTVFDKNEKPGGMMVYGVPSFKMEKDVVAAEIDVLRELGVEFQCGVDVGKDVTLDELRAKGYKGFYIAIGCQGGRKANVPGEDAKNVTMAVDFLRKVGQDEAFKVKGNTVVIGGGNVAIDVTRTAFRCGSDSVRMFCLEQRDEMPAADDEVAEAEEEGIVVDCGWGPKEILKDKKGAVKGIILKKCVSVFDENHKFAPKYDEDDTVTVDCESIVLSIGQSIVWGDLLKGTAVEFGRGNGAVADPHTYQTAQPDVFVGGDVYTGPKFVIDAIAAGRQGAESLHRFVHEGCTLTIGRDWRELTALDKDNITIPAEYDKTPRQAHGLNPKIDQHKSFRDPKLPFTEEQVIKETARCLVCGASVVDENRCIGCGICTTKCKFDAIHLYRDLPQCSKMDRTEDKIKIVVANAAKRAIRLKKEDLLNR